MNRNIIALLALVVAACSNDGPSDIERRAIEAECILSAGDSVEITNDGRTYEVPCPNKSR